MSQEIESKKTNLEIDTNPTPGVIQNFMTPRRQRGVDLTLAGAGGFLALWVFSLFGPMAIGLYGLYRLARKQWISGTSILIFALALYMGIKFFGGWLVIFKVASLILLIIGLILFFKPSRD